MKYVVASIGARALAKLTIEEKKALGVDNFK